MTTAKVKREKRLAARSPRIVTDAGIVWSLVLGGRATEPAFAGGKERRQQVDTKTYCYLMTCVCGRERYAKPNALYEVTKCRLCTRTERLKRRRTKAWE